MKTFIKFSVLVFVFAAVSVHAADLTIFGGVQNPGKLTKESAVSGASVLLNPRNFGTFGVRLSQGRILGSEHTLAYSPNFLSSENSGFIYNSNLMVHIPLGLARPYGTVGAGTIVIGGDGIEDITGGKFAINYGGGLKFSLAGPVGAQIDARGYTLPSVLDETLHVFEVSAGIVFSF